MTLAEAIEALERTAQAHASTAKGWALEIVPVPADPLGQRRFNLLGRMLLCLLSCAVREETPLPRHLAEQVGPVLGVLLGPAPAGGYRMLVGDTTCVVAGQCVGRVNNVPAHQAALMMISTAPADVNRALWAMIAAAAGWPTSSGGCGACVAVAVFDPDPMAEA